jgi:N-acetylglutamate synthase-like GNAT family acetyltransferase
VNISFKIRKYQSEDLKQCRALWKELTDWHCEIYQDPTIGGVHPEEYFDKHLAEIGPESLWVAVHNSQVVGFTGLIIKGKGAEIEPLIISKSYRHKGIGKQLVETVINQARNKGIRFLNVKPVARNIQAITFFYEQGFTKLGRIELFIDFSDYAWKQGPELFGCAFDF